MRGVLALLPCLAALPLSAHAQTAQPPGTPDRMVVQPIECWWRTTSNAVRVGELFDVILTCAVINTSSTTVVPDQSRLDPAVLQLPPFEVTGGSQSTDLTTPSRRFF